jgi:hypothetical protein
MTTGRLVWALALLTLACQRRVVPTQPPRIAAATLTDRPTIYLIKLGDRGHLGKAAGCGDSAVPVAIPVERPVPALVGAFRALLAERPQLDASTGLSNPLYASQLSLTGIDHVGPRTLVRLRGYLELGDACDKARIRAQLTETARQFSDLTSVSVLVEGQPLETVLAGGAALDRGGNVAGAPSEPAGVLPAPPTAEPPELPAPPAASPESNPESPPPPPVD